MASIRTPRYQFAVVGTLLFAGIFAAGIGLVAGTAVGSRAQIHDRSDRFWAYALPNAMSAESFDSLADLAQNADLVVVGRISIVDKGREWVANPSLAADPTFHDLGIARYATAHIKVVSVIGAPRVAVRDDEVKMEIFMPHEETLGALQANTPAELALFFLRNKGPSDSVDYFRLVNFHQSVLRDLDGITHVPWNAFDPFMLALEGGSFAETVDVVRRLLE